VILNRKKNDINIFSAGFEEKVGYQKYIKDLLFNQSESPAEI
jgi:hypothetical protein